MLHGAEWNSAGPGRPDTSIYFLDRPSVLSATQLHEIKVIKKPALWHVKELTCNFRNLLAWHDESSMCVDYLAMTWFVCRWVEVEMNFGTMRPVRQRQLSEMSFVIIHNYSVFTSHWHFNEGLTSNNKKSLKLFLYAFNMVWYECELNKKAHIMQIDNLLKSWKSFFFFPSSMRGCWRGFWNYSTWSFLLLVVPFFRIVLIISLPSSSPLSLRTFISAWNIRRRRIIDDKLLQ